MPDPQPTSGDLNRWIDQAREAWAALDEKIDTFRAAAGIACPAGCGRCCEVSAVETTVVECLPMAQHLIDTGQADAVLARIETPGEVPPLATHDARTTETDDVEAEAANLGVPARCALYEPGSLPGRGQCGHYPHRPTICRLYGFAARIDGGIRLVGCSIHDDDTPGSLTAAQSAIDAGTADPPLYATELARVTLRSPTLGRTRHPINESLRRAIHHLRAASSEPSETEPRA